VILFLLGLTTALALRPPDWRRVLDRLNRWASIGAKPQGFYVGDGFGLRHLLAAERHESWGQHTAEFHQLVRTAWMPDDEGAVT
jgi:hypothetical protein